MLNLEKNPFAKSTSTPSSAGSSITAADKAVKRWQLEYGRTRKRVEDFSSQLDAAREAFAKISIESVADELLDVTAVADAMTQAREKVQALEAAQKVAQQRDDAAQAALKQAQSQVLIEAEAAALARLRAVALLGDRILGELESWVRNELSPSLAAAYAAAATCGRSEGQTAFLHAFRQAFVLCVNRACKPFIQDGRAGLTGFKDRKLSSWMPDQDPMGTRPRE